MSEDLNLKTEGSQDAHHHKHHHRSHHHHHRHHSHHHHKDGSHHSSSHRSSHHSSSSRRKKQKNTGIFKKIKSFFKRLSRKLTIDTSSYRNKIKKVARSSKSDNRAKYSTVSKRVLFGVVVIAIVSYIFFLIITIDEDTNMKNAGSTPSETSILKIQVMELEQKNAALQKELNRYKELYGELEELN